MSRGASTRRHVFLPYRFEPAALVLVVDACELDGRPVADRAFDAERGLLDLSGHRFDRARLSLAIVVPPDLFAAVFDQRELASIPGSLLVQVHCPATRLRRAVEGPRASLASGRHSVEVSLAHSDVAGSLILTPYLVRHGSTDEISDDHASDHGSRLASGRSIEVRIDLLRPPPGEFLDIRYESFKTKGAPQFPHMNTLYKLECGENPILWLNADHERVCAVLDDRANIGRMARVRDVLFDQVAHVVWTRLFLHAAADYARNGEALFQWQEAVLATLLPSVYPDVPDHESRIAALIADVNAGDQMDLLGNLEAGLQEWLEVAHHATALAEELT